MENLRFNIPQRLEDLLHASDDPNVYYIIDELTAREISIRLPTCEQHLEEDGPEALCQDFEVFFSLLRQFQTIDRHQIDRCWNLIRNAMNLLKLRLRDLFDSFQSNSFSQLNISEQHNSSQRSISQRIALFETPTERQVMCNTIKALSFVTCSFIEAFEDLHASKSSKNAFNDSFSEKSGRQRAKKHCSKKNTEQDGVFEEFEKYKEKLIENMHVLMLFPLKRIFDPSIGQEEIATLYMRSCYKLVETSANTTKNRGLLENVFGILGCGVERYNQSLSFCLKIIQLLQHKEQLAPMLAALVEYIVTKHNQRLLIVEILREVERIDIGELSRDSSCPRAISTFLIDLSERCPEEFLPSLSHLVPYLEEDSYIMRNATISIFGNIILRVLSKSDLDEAQRKLRDELLDYIFDHIHDVTAYTRVRSIGVWCMLGDNGRIPIKRLEPVTKMVVGRLKDKSCFVRKAAVRFLISVLQNNPFSKRLPLTYFKERYSAEKAELDRLVAEEQAADDDATTEEDSPVVVKQRQVSFLEDAISFTEQIHRAVPIICELLYSKNITDIQEAIDFFVCCHNFDIDEALIGFKKMILLINSREKTIKESVTGSYKKIYFESPKLTNKSQQERVTMIVSEFINFVEIATIGEVICLEGLLKEFLESRDFTRPMVQELWARFTLVKPNSTIRDSIGAIQILGMLAASDPDIINDNFDLCVQHGLNTNSWKHPEQTTRLVRETCVTLLKSLPKVTLEDKNPPLFRRPQADDIFKRLSDILVESLCNPDCGNWYAMCEESLKVIFRFAENPDSISREVYSRMTDELQNNSSQSEMNPRYLARFLHYLGDLAINMLLHLEVYVCIEYQRRYLLSKEKENNKGLLNVSISSRRHSRRYTMHSLANTSTDAANLDEDVGLGDAGNELDTIEMELKNMCDEILGDRHLLGRASKLIKSIASDSVNSNIELRLASVTALSKYMILSEKFCYENIEFLFNILEQSQESEVKINLIVAISDLCVRFPNLLDSRTPRIFNFLQHTDVEVRKTTLKIISRLILSDMIKVKEDISYIAKLIVDDDEDLASGSRYFFLELSKKNTIIYDKLSDIISNLSNENSGIDEEEFRIVMKFLFGLIDKNRQIETLIEKLSKRFQETVLERQWCDLAYCLTLLKYSDRAMAKLFEKFDCYKDKLCLDSVHESITSIVASYRKQPNNKTEVKQLLDEFDARIESAIRVSA